MNEVLKQRLVGALILLALGVVFWPIIFVDQSVPENTPIGSMPPAPVVDATAIERPSQAGLRSSPPLPQPEEIIEQQAAIATDTVVEQEVQPALPHQEGPEAAAAVEVAPEAAQAGLRDEPPEKPKLDTDGVPIAWMLQVASVSSAEKADALRQQLLDMGHRAYAKRIRANGRDLWRVYVGPKFEKAQLEALRSTVDNALGVKTLVVRYYP